jgi:tRNA dimethylallyltransferase
MQPTLVVIVGATASGKSAAAQAVATHFQSPILVADSRQVYRRLNIGTNKPSPAERQQWPYHLIDLAEPEQPFTVWDYEQAALHTLNHLFAQHPLLVLEGGTGFYLQAVEQGTPSTPPIDAAVRQAVQHDLTTAGLAVLVEEIRRRDPTAFAEMDLQNPRRVARAVEVMRQTGQPFSWFRPVPQPRPWRVLKVGIQAELPALMERIHQRVGAMLAAGLLAEVEQLLAEGLSAYSQSMSSIGYRELVQHLQGHCTLEAALERIRLNTVQYAKRQQTWFRKHAPQHWCAPHEVLPWLLQQGVGAGF